jgi:hypothetical protein
MAVICAYPSFDCEREMALTALWRNPLLGCQSVKV